MLRLINDSGRRHNFTAPEFFAAATIEPGQPVRTDYGEIEVPGHATVEIRLTPRRGNYELSCSRSGHEMLGMQGDISVD